MLPKFASHVLHHTQRAAATVQNYALRNVLGLQNPSTSQGSLNQWSNAGSSSWGGYGAGAGGAKYNTGSRFYQSYTNAGRAVTQANSSSNGRTDEEDDLHLNRSTLVIRTRNRQRSSSLSLTGTGRKESADTFGVLKSIQLHQARAKHVLARVAGVDAPIESEQQRDITDPSSSRRLIRRNSTAASDIDSLEALEALEEPPEPVVPHQTTAADLLPTDASAPQTSIAPGAAFEDARDNAGEPASFEVYRRIEAARKSEDQSRVTAEVMNFRTSHPNPNVREYNIALYALLTTRIAGEPITMILETYNEMLTRQIAPNVQTYRTMILALCERDKEVNRVIQQLETRQKRRKRWSAEEAVIDQTEAGQMELLRKEDNFASAVVIFEAAQSIYRSRSGENLSLGHTTYIALLRSCALHGNVDAAVRVWSTLESAQNFFPSASAYFQLLSVYVNVNDIESATDVFKEFRLASKEGRISWEGDIGGETEELSTFLLQDSTRSGAARGAQMLVWMKMVEAYFRAKQPVKAIALLEEMMDSDAGVDYGAADVPPPCPAIYSAFITGFIRNGDIQSALSWFNRMLRQDSVSMHDLQPTLSTPRPNQWAWYAMLEATVDHKLVAEANRLLRILISIADRDGVRIRNFDRISVLRLNATYLEEHPGLSEKELNAIVTFLLEDAVRPAFGQRQLALALMEEHRPAFLSLINVLCKRRKFDAALTLLERYIKDGQQSILNIEASGDHLKRALFRTISLRQVLPQVVDTLIIRPGVAGSPHSLSIDHATRFAALADSLTYAFTPVQTAHMLMPFYAERRHGDLSKLTNAQWAHFMNMSCNFAKLGNKGLELYKDQLPNNFHFRGLRELVSDIKRSGYDPTVNGQAGKPVRRLVEVFINLHGVEEAREALSSMAPGFAAHLSLNTQGKRRPPVNIQKVNTKDERPVHVDKFHSRSVDEYYPVNPKVSPQMAWTRYTSGAAFNRFPLPDVMGRLISTFGRLGDLDKVHCIYKDAQTVLTLFEDDKERQSQFWYTIEDQMIIALAHAGEVENAHIHRQRIIEQGANPSPDAYGALIQCVKETTDDSANATALWHESQYRGVIPNLYLFNTIISKLSKARKADFALELFQQMKASYIRPSSVTYGAVIAACCRVGDAQSAEILFEEMTAQKNFRPRIPPYNTMIQFYTHVVRDRDRALHYFGAMLEAGINPSAHTYKLLIDCYGTIEPVDVESMEDVFSKLAIDRHVQVTGVHWAAVINAWGCVKRDLAKAMDIFDSIETHPSTQMSKLQLPDAVAYESMINVLVTLRRADLISSYLNRLTGSGIHMTAYIANLLIKGFAAAGDIHRAREIFESLQDPPTGRAAPNNHTPHDSSPQDVVAADAPVYREPSTWEAMVRVELGNGNRDRAADLLKRVHARQFPQPVFQRISGIMLDDSVSPWTSQYTETAIPSL